MKTLEEKIKIVTNDIQEKFPNCLYTINILLWNDNTTKVECRHGVITEEGKIKIHLSTYYDDILTYKILELGKQNGMLVDELGTKYYKE